MATRTDYSIQKSLDHLYLNAAWPNIGDAAGLPASAVAGNLYAALLKDGVEVNYGGYASRSINIGGTNADPDTTSGGYNGTAARTSLQGKGFTVTIT